MNLVVFWLQSKSLQLQIIEQCNFVFHWIKIHFTNSILIILIDGQQLAVLVAKLRDIKAMDYEAYLNTGL